MTCRHALIVGGTGMLAGVCIRLAEAGSVVSVVSRRGRTPSVDAPTTEHLHGIAADWSQREALVEAFDAAVAARGPVDLAVLWVHANGAEALRALARRLPPTADVVHVRGSAAGHPQAEPSIVEHPRRREVVLGFVREGAASRWLTHAEIASGVLAAIAGEGDHVVGTVTPWSARP